MSLSWSAILRCPYCRKGFRFDETPPPPEAAAEFGVLRCGCGAFPVVDGIPIVMRGKVSVFEHTTGETEVDGTDVPDLVRLLESGKPLEALRECLALPALPPVLRKRLPWRVINDRRVRRLARWLGKRELSRQVLARRETLSARALFQFFYRPGRPLAAGVGHYFLLRFCQPRHLAALALAVNIRPSDKPVLDIACGVGHFEHYLTQRRDPVPALGTDLNFFQLWIARHWIAPKAQFVCTNAQDGLPFQDGVFSATLCSDAYHYIRNRRDLQLEIERCAPHCPVVLTRVGNRAVMPNEGVEVTVPEYLNEFGATDIYAFCEADLLRSYLARRNPIAHAARAPSRLTDEKWLSFAWNISASSGDGTWEEDMWPHAVGAVGINPIYAVTSSANGDLELRFEFPLAWYAYENHAMLSYHPRRVTVTQVDYKNRSRWPDDRGISSLIRSFVMIGLPERF